VNREGHDGGRVFPDTGRYLVITSSADPVGRPESAASIYASLEGPRAATERSRRGVEARFVQRRSRSAAGGAPSEKCRVVAQRVTVVLGDRVDGRDHPGKRVTGLGVLGA
jgi:hypothetical protein